MSIGIELMDCYVPGNRLSAREFYHILQKEYGYAKTDREIEDFIKNASLGEVTVENEKNRIEMIETLFDNIFSKRGYNPEKIDFVIFTADIPECYRDITVYQLYFMKKYGLSRANYFTMNQQCGTQLNAINLAESLIKTEKAEKVMIVSHNYIANVEHRLLDGYGIFGDGAAAAVISSGCITMKFKKFKTVINPSYYNLKETPNSGTKYLEYLLNGVKSINELVKDEMPLDSFDMIIPQNVNAMEWEYYCAKLRYPIEKVFLQNIANYGHVGDADALLNLKDAYDKDVIKAGDNIILQSVGAGASFNSLWLEV